MGNDIVRVDPHLAVDFNHNPNIIQEVDVDQFKQELNPNVDDLLYPQWDWQPSVHCGYNTVNTIYTIPKLDIIKLPYPCPT